jgi:hypothetical protein
VVKGGEGDGGGEEAKREMARAAAREELAAVKVGKVTTMVG